MLSFNSLYWVLADIEAAKMLADLPFQFPLLGSKTVREKGEALYTALSIPFIGFDLYEAKMKDDKVLKSFNSLYWVHAFKISSITITLTFNSLYWVQFSLDTRRRDSRDILSIPFIGFSIFGSFLESKQQLLSIPFIGFALLLKQGHS